MGRQLWIWVSSILVFCMVAFGIVQSPGFNRLKPVESVTGLPLLEQSTEAALVPAAANDTESTQDLIPATAPTLAQSAPNYQPLEEIALAHPTNYGDRYATDINGRPVFNRFIVVIHETVGSARSAINLFQTPHPNDADQVSYHTLIAQDGTVIYIVPPENRAYGAGNSVFDGPDGLETVATHPTLPPSVNNFAYHVSLESPADGRGRGSTHSGYTQAQYESLAWLLARTDIPDNRITTHRSVDRSGSRIDPRSFDPNRFLSLLHRYPMRTAATDAIAMEEVRS
ncbi:MAG: peptidoglycan recognition family protein [Cyanobacteria bacterium P01_A01_bin.123]